MQTELTQTHLHATIQRMGRDGLLLRVERQLGCLLTVIIENLYGLGPRFPLAGIDLSQIEQRPLYPRAPRSAYLLRDTPVAVALAVLFTSVAVQEWLSHKRYWVAYLIFSPSGKG